MVWEIDQMCYSLRDLCIQTDSAWCKLKKYCHLKNISNFPDGSTLYLKSFFVGSILPVKKSIQITKIKENERERAKNKCMVCSVWIILTFYSDLITYFAFICFRLHCLLLGSRWHKFINSSKQSSCFLKATVLMLTLFFILIFPKK